MEIQARAADLTSDESGALQDLSGNLVMIPTHAGEALRTTAIPAVESCPMPLVPKRPYPKTDILQHLRLLNGNMAECPDAITAQGIPACGTGQGTAREVRAQRGRKGCEACSRGEMARDAAGGKGGAERDARWSGGGVELEVEAEDGITEGGGEGVGLLTGGGTEGGERFGGTCCAAERSGGGLAG